jgi:putative transposase
MVVFECGQVKVPELVGPALPTPTASVGIDLGLKTCATTSDGAKIEGRFYRGLSANLGIAQRAGKKARVRAIHAKIGNQRKDLLHKFSTALVRDNAAIFVGDVASASWSKPRWPRARWTRAGHR